MCDFTIESRYLNGFTCIADDVRYHVTTTKGVTSVWTWLPDEDDDMDGMWDFDRLIPEDVMRHIALELYLVFDILLDGFEYLSPSQYARKRALAAALEAYGV